VEAECIVEVRQDGSGNPTDDPAEPLDRDGADLLGLCLGVELEARVFRRQEVWNGKVLSVLLVTGTTVTTPRPSLAAMELARSLRGSTRASGTWCGHASGHDERASRPTNPASSYRRSQAWTDCRDTPHCCATSLTERPSDSTAITA
jgi:hypothetical protein